MASTRRSAIRRMAMTAAVLAILPPLAACTPGVTSPTPRPTVSTPLSPVVVGAPDTAEGAVIAELYSGALQAAGVPSSVKPGVGGRMATLEALKSGTVQVVPAYTGSLLRALDGTPKDSSEDAVRSAAAAALSKPMTVLDASGAQDRAVVAVTKVTAEKFQLKTLEDLGKVCGQVVLAAAADFSGDPFGAPALKSAYSCTPKRTVTYGMKSGPDGGPAAPSGDRQGRYVIPQPLKSLLEDDAQAAVLLSTDPAIADNDLVVLEDNKKALLPDQVIPVVGPGGLPDQARDTLNNLSHTLTSDDLMQMNRAVQGDQGRTPHEVAISWLKDKGIVK